MMSNDEQNLSFELTLIEEYHVKFENENIDIHVLFCIYSYSTRRNSKSIQKKIISLVSR